MDTLLREYLPILVLLAVATGLGLLLLGAAALIAVRHPDPEMRRTKRHPLTLQVGETGGYLL